MRRVGLAAAMVLAAGAASAQTPSLPACVAPEPTPADSERPAAMPPKPPMPKCINPRGISRCPESVAQAYSDQVAVYNDQVRLHSIQDQAFVVRLNVWARQVDAYAQCEVNTLNAENERY
jgi:hypothetical protein